MIYIILFVSVLLVYVFFDLINAQFKSKKEPIKRDKPRKTDLNEIYKDITLEPYVWFSSLGGKFFLKKETD